MKYLLAFLISFNVYGVALVDPEEARASVEKALETEGWSITLSDFVTDGRVVLDHPTSKKQIIMDNVFITFYDIGQD